MTKQNPAAILHDPTPRVFRSILREVLGDAVYEHFPFKMHREHTAPEWVAALYEQMIRVPSVEENDLKAVDKIFSERYGKHIRFGLYTKFNGEARWVVRIPMLTNAELGKTS
jgi:hypothetical protein